MTIPTPTPVKPGTPDTGNGQHLPPGGNGHGGNTGWPEEAPGPKFPSRRRSVWPMLLDLGLVLMLFGLIITGRFLIPIGLLIFLVALFGWLREARADYRRLKD